ncbi:multidrug efflux system membrane fusion protein [Natronocella acetinitrilica]|uniref:Multidrug efflux system membrane fusion protein n=1 Tax=Natronocella acetinitrilica TaxID=414046 RepID=A0AAE3G0Q0_9GAMM|nr:efflux RND transporter periplasmic adaptor subunit [Natronocella acetinitrilica]MCP1673600.1 multidrug efflux system membrane fusion protein [Natronocella acetinitrilica]
MAKPHELFGRIANPTTLVFVALILLVVGWIGSGMIGRDLAIDSAQPPPRIPTVAASWSEAVPITREIVLYGDVEPNQVVTLRARVDGIVEAMTVVGYQAEAGEVLGRLSTDDREARLARAQAQVASAQRNYDSALDLARGGFAPQSDVQMRLAELEAARADLRAIELEIGNTSLRAPISGVVSRVETEVGAYVAAGGEVLRIVDNNPLIAVVRVPQAAVARLATGMQAAVRFIGGEERSGIVRFISPIADAATRTFRVELEVDNSERPLPAGLSVEVVVPTDTIDAHRVSAALVRLDAQGRIGLQTVDADDRITFSPVEVVRARADAIWITGLPERARIVTISRGLLSPGQQVDVRDTPDEYLQPGDS